MFLRKLFKVPDKIRWLSLELLVVFVGVYLAFVFQSYSERQKISAEKEKVLTSLKRELEEFRTSLPGFASYQENKTKEWDSLLRIGEVREFYNWRYLEPQYNFQVIEYAINLQSSEIISFDLYEALMNLYKEIKQLEHVERLMTEFSGEYNSIPADLNQNSEAIRLLKADNIYHFFRFNQFAKDRINGLHSVAKAAEDNLVMIDEQLGPDKVEQIELGYLQEFVDSGVGDDYIINRFLRIFPEYDSGRVIGEITRLRNQ